MRNIDMTPIQEGWRSQ